MLFVRCSSHCFHSPCWYIFYNINIKMSSKITKMGSNSKDCNLKNNHNIIYVQTLVNIFEESLSCDCQELRLFISIVQNHFHLKSTYFTDFVIHVHIYSFLGTINLTWVGWGLNIFSLSGTAEIFVDTNCRDNFIFSSKSRFFQGIKCFRIFCSSHVGDRHFFLSNLLKKT